MLTDWRTVSRCVIAALALISASLALLSATSQRDDRFTYAFRATAGATIALNVARQP